MKTSGFLNKRSASVVLALAAFWLLATPIRPGAPQAPNPPGPIIVPLRAESVPLSLEQPGLSRTGALDYLGGWVLEADSDRFGGISALHVDGDLATAISDTGELIRFAVPGSPRFGAVRIARLAAGPTPVRRKADRDAEAMLVAGDDVWVVWENRREVWRYGRDWRARAAARPAAMRRFGRHAGAEAIARLPGGRFLILSETATGSPGLYRALLFGGDPAQPGTATMPLLYRPPAGFRATDAASLPDGRLLVLNRRAEIWEGIGAALTVVDPATIRPGATIEGREIARLQWPLTVDNMEALAVTREAGRTILWIASDDNFTPIQRTLLLRFALRP
ncbi:MAG: esterase-like activity of phytase family protein [Sphingomonas sp.]